MTRRAKWIAGVVTLALVGGLSSVALAKEAAVRVEVSPLLVPRGSHYVMTASGVVSVHEDLNLVVKISTTGCTESAHHKGEIILQRTVKPGHFSYHQTVYTKKTDAIGLRHACAYVYNPYLFPATRFGTADHPFAREGLTFKLT